MIWTAFLWYPTVFLGLFATREEAVQAILTVVAENDYTHELVVENFDAVTNIVCNRDDIGQAAVFNIGEPVYVELS